jgi:hypothetical protein
MFGLPKHPQRLVRSICVWVGSTVRQEHLASNAPSPLPPFLTLATSPPSHFPLSSLLIPTDGTSPGYGHLRNRYPLGTLGAPFETLKRFPVLPRVILESALSNMRETLGSYSNLHSEWVLLQSISKDS